MQVDRYKRLESMSIPDDIDYNHITSISREGREKLISIKPASIGQASRIPGLTPACLLYTSRCV